MADRLSVILTEPTDDSLPIDVQMVALRRKAIEAMQEVADVDEQTVRYKGGTEDATVDLGDGHLIATWQCNLRAARFTADGTVRDGVLVPVVHAGSPLTRIATGVAFVRNEFD